MHAWNFTSRALLFAALCSAAEGARTKPGAGSRTYTSTPNDQGSSAAQKDDLPFIACDTCYVAVEQFHKQIQAVRERNKGKLREAAIDHLMKKICGPDMKQGRWASHYDIVEIKVDDGVQLKLSEYPDSGMCEIECRTIAQSCDELFKEEIDTDKFAAAILRDDDLSDLHEAFCNKGSRRCTQAKVSRVMPRGKRTDYTYKRKTDEARKYDRIIDALQDGGVMGDDTGNAAEDAVSRFDRVLEELELSGEL